MRLPFDAEAVAELEDAAVWYERDSVPSWPLLTAVVGPDIGATD